MELIDDFTRGFIDAALWATNDESTPAGGEPLDKNYNVDDLDQSSLDAIIKTCEKFQTENESDLVAVCKLYHIVDGDTPMAYAGHDFFLTSAGHGVGFWDRGFYELGDRLTAASKKYNEVHIYVGGDGKLYM